MTTTPKQLVLVRANHREHRALADLFGKYRRTIDGFARYEMTDNRTAKFVLVRNAGFVVADARRKRFTIPGCGKAVFTLSQAVAVGRKMR